jgi:hypothetical protein
VSSTFAAAAVDAEGDVDASAGGEASEEAAAEDGRGLAGEDEGVAVAVGAVVGGVRDLSVVWQPTRTAATNAVEAARAAPRRTTLACMEPGWWHRSRTPIGYHPPNAATARRRGR